MVATMWVGVVEGERVAQVTCGKPARVVVFESVDVTPTLRVFDVVHYRAEPG